MSCRDKTAAARHAAERLIEMMTKEVDAYFVASDRAEREEPSDADAGRDRVGEAREVLTRAPLNDIDGIDVQTEFVDLRTAQDAEARITKHVATASIRVNGPNRIRIHCVRDGERFGVTHVSACEYGQVAEVVPGKAAATQVDVYAGAILDVYAGAILDVYGL